MSLHVFLASNSIILHPVSGQDFYMKSLINVSNELGHKTLFISPTQVPRLREIFKLHNVYIHHYYTNVVSDVIAKISAPKTKHLLYIFQLRDATWTPYNRVKYLSYIYSSQLIMDRYVVTGKSVYNELMHNPITLRMKGRIHLVEPYYECHCNSMEIARRKARMLLEENVLELIYVGGVNSVRINVQKLIDLLKLLARDFSKVRLTIISMRERGLKLEGVFRKENLEIELVSHRLPENIKRSYYKRAHVFLYLARLPSAMHPPLALIESVCYGLVPVVTQHVTRDLEVPEQLVINNDYCVEDVLKSIKNITENYLSIFQNTYKRFTNFYSKSRFVKDLSKLLED